MPPEARNCPDCDRVLVAIQLFDKRGLGMTAHGDLEYAVNEATRSKWTDQFPVEGKLRGYMCDGCGRVLLYAEGKN